MPVVKAFYQDPFKPVLFSSPPLDVTNEQRDYLRRVLDKACSDSRFAEKAYIAIGLILTGGITKVPTVASLTPNSAEVGDPNPTLHVHGTNFTAGSKIIFNGGEEVTTFVSATELTTVVNMSTVSGAAVVPVAVMSEDGVLSNPMNFAFTDGTPAALLTQKTEEKKLVPTTVKK
jgi:hypothetical protein